MHERVETFGDGDCVFVVVAVGGCVLLQHEFLGDNGVDASAHARG